MPSLLIVERDPAVRQAMSLVVASLDYEVLLAAGTVEGIFLAEARSFDLAIVEMDLPRLDGVEAVAAFARLLPPRPVVATVQNVLRDGEDPRARAFALGAAAVLAKPFSRDALLQAIADALLDVRTAPEGARASPSTSSRGTPRRRP